MIKSIPKDERTAIQLLSDIEAHGGTKGYSKKIKKPTRTVQYWSKKSREICGWDSKPLASGSIKPFDHSSIKLKGKKYVFTAAQNNTYVHDDFFNSLKKYCNENDAELIISKFTYNKSGFNNITKESEGVWYDPKLEPYFLSERAQICKGLAWCGELDILPTAVNPTSGLESYSEKSSAIIPHSKLHMKSVATMKGDEPRFLYTKGALTKRNYIQRKAGQKAEFHHTFGALVVEKSKNGNWFCRQLNADDKGCFYDLDTYYTPKSCKKNQRVEAINWGDIHIEKMDGTIEKGAWDSEGSMLSKLRPKYQFIHDLSDFEARNHHNIKDPHFLAYQHFQGINNVEKGLKMSADFLSKVDRKDCKTVVVESNHDQAYKRWLAQADIKRDPENARFFHESNAELYRNIENGNNDFHIFEWAVRGMANYKNITFLKEDESFVVKGIECGMHGHRGTNGSMGSPNAYKGIGRKANTGHTHSAGIIDGVYTSGVSASMDMGYNIGPSSWSFSHIVTYANGKRAIITMRGNKWKC